MRECPACKLCFPDDVQNCPIDGDATFHSISGEPILEGKYQLEKRLGQGGMGVVYKARHNFLKTSHAIKVILPDLVGNDPNLVTRFRQEAIAAAAIRHQNIVSVTDFGVVNGKMPFLVMEFVQGESLHDLLVREKRLSPVQALDILSSICAGLGAAHRQGIVHRDLKPLNVMIQNGVPLEEGVKLLDFGLAKIKSGELLGSFIQAQTTGLMGSPYYMAPEQWSDDEPDARADIYSLGVMFYQMLAGDVPFKGTSIPSIMRKHLSDPPPKFSEFGVEVSPEIEQAVGHALAKDAEKRAASAEQLIAELRRAVGVSHADLSVSDPKLMADTLGGRRTAPKIDIGAQQRRAADGITTLRILTNPPQAKVFVDNKQVGVSEANGWLIAPNIPRGTHNLKVSSDGFLDSESQINCDSEVFQTVIQLRSLLATNVSTDAKVTDGQKSGYVQSKNNITAAPDTMVNLPPANTGAEANIALNADAVKQGQAQNVGIRSYPEPKFEKTNIGTKPQGLKSGTIATPILPPPVITTPEKKTSYVLPVLLGVLLIGLVVLGGGGYAVYRFVINPEVVTNPSPQPSAQPSVAPSPGGNTTVTKADMVKIEGGKFQMGRSAGPIDTPEEPAHEKTVETFWMDKTEVTNAEYAQFVSEMKYPAPEGWVDGKPLNGQEQYPVTKVTLENARAFAKWRSNRDKVNYRLPKEEEWEYAARNGAKQNFYPWGNTFENGRAVVNQSSQLPVGTLKNGANQWGVLDLIGNVYEWTDTPASLYPGNNVLTIKDKDKGHYMIRGGCFVNSLKQPERITSTARQTWSPDEPSPQLGFRLVRSDK